jgi:hypothetical protein
MEVWPVQPLLGFFTKVTTIQLPMANMVPSGRPATINLQIPLGWLGSIFTRLFPLKSLTVSARLKFFG